MVGTPNLKVKWISDTQVLVEYDWFEQGEGAYQESRKWKDVFIEYRETKRSGYRSEPAVIGGAAQGSLQL